MNKSFKSLCDSIASMVSISPGIYWFVSKYFMEYSFHSMQCYASRCAAVLAVKQIVLKLGRETPSLLFL
jgi:hypothetical protein